MQRIVARLLEPKAYRPAVGRETLAEEVGAMRAEAMRVPWGDLEDATPPGVEAEIADSRG